MPTLDKTDFDFVGAAADVDWTGTGSPRPGSAGAQAVRLNTELAHTPPADILSAMAAKAASVANVLTSHLDFWAAGDVGGTGGAAGEAVIPFPLFRVTTPGVSGKGPGGLNMAVTGAAQVGFLALPGAVTRLATYLPPPKDSGYLHFRSNFAEFSGGFRTHQEVFNSDLGNWQLLSHIVDVSAGAVAAGRAGIMVFGSAHTGQYIDLDDAHHTETIDFPVANHIAGGTRINVGFEDLEWTRQIAVAGQTIGAPATLPSVVAGGRPGSAGSNKLAVTLEDSTFRAFHSPSLVLRAATQNKDREIEVWVQVPALPASGSFVIGLRLAKWLFNAPTNDADDLGVEFSISSAGNLMADRVSGAVSAGDGGEGVLATVAPGDWFGFRARFKQFGLSEPALDASWNKNNTGWNTLPLLSALPVQTTYQIVGVNQGTKTFTMQNAIAEAFPAGATFTVAASTGNDGVYTVDSVVAAGADLDVTVVEAIPDPTVDGNATLPDYRLLDISVLGYVAVEALGATGGPWTFHIDDYEEQEF